MKKNLPLLTAFLMLSACSSKKPEYAEDKPLAEIYKSAQVAMKNNDAKEAAKLFTDVERQYPYSTWATKALLQAAYAHYLSTDYNDAIDILEKFIQLNPTHKDIAYAYYLKALCLYEQIPDSERDQAITHKAQQALQEIITRFPGTQYAKDAKFKWDFAQDRFAEGEMQIGRYYLNKKSYISAINRFAGVVKNYQTTNYTPEALFRLVEAYLAIAARQEAIAAAAYLNYNYPDSKWYSYAYARMRKENIPLETNEPFLRRMWKKIF